MTRRRCRQPGWGIPKCFPVRLLTRRPQVQIQVSNSNYPDRSSSQAKYSPFCPVILRFEWDMIHYSNMNTKIFFQAICIKKKVFRNTGIFAAAGAADTNRPVAAERCLM